MAKPTVEQRFWAKVDKFGPSGCWLWTGAPNYWGYGRFSIGTKEIPAHRFAYESAIGPIPDGLHIDHLCRVRLCVNPSHLEPVTPAENLLRGEGAMAKLARQTYCKHGHEFTPENTRIRRNGHRVCKKCGLARTRAWLARNRKERP